MISKNPAPIDVHDTLALRPFFDTLTDNAGFHLLCDHSACHRARRCAYPSLERCRDATQHARLLMRIGMPYCLAQIWEHVREDVRQALEQAGLFEGQSSLEADVHGTGL